MKFACLLVALAFVAPQTSSLGARNASVAVDWTRTVAKTPAGGYRMGNPNAKLKLVEFGSMTCPHCRAFDDEGADPLIRTYVKTGKVSFEFRNYVRDPYDLGASLIARCNGAKSFFALTRALFKDQPQWVAKAQSATPERIEAMKGLPPNRLFLESARIAGLQQWATTRGVPVARSGQCLANEKEIERLVDMNRAAAEQYPDFPGTPTFILNGKMLEKTVTWADLQPKLQAALGG